jgi:hypothetical protein
MSQTKRAKTHLLLLAFRHSADVNEADPDVTNEKVATTRAMQSTVEMLIL